VKINTNKEPSEDKKEPQENIKTETDTSEEDDPEVEIRENPKE